MNSTIFSKLLKLHIITPGGIFNIFKNFIGDGISIMALMRFSAKYYPERCALVADGKRFTYKEMYEYAISLAKILFADYDFKAGMSVGLLCRNHIIVALLLPALSRLGVAVKLINTGMAQSKVRELAKSIEFLILDSELNEARVPGGLSCQMIETEELRDKTFDNERNYNITLPHTKRGGEISVFTGGSSGNHKEASRKMRVNQYLPPLFALLKDLNIDKYDSVFMPLPLYHGFGLATLIISFLMGKKVCLMNHFDTDEALRIIAEEKIEVLPVVPAMLARLWQTDDAASRMKTLKCIISGGDRLDRKWIDITIKHLGNVIYNLYGTSEAGFFMIASPHDLLKNEEVTIGRPIRGVKCKVENIDSNATGELWVRSGWAMIGMKDKWQNTGDLVHCNAAGYYFYRGRTDNMVVCGGENIYPENVEKVINGHPDVTNSMVYPTHDALFGTVINAQVELKSNSTIMPDEIKEWLRPRLSRAEMPHEISITTINLSETGKPLRYEG
ncbi:MAG: AMP-binding protein [Muribaculaceae bacterium]|nr:AMP-binding protein [Muribaculaceae bacterium]